MKKIISVCILTVLTLALSSCACEHNWKYATCITPKTCSLCEATEGTRAEHIWIEATCIDPKTCTTCGKTEGSPSPSAHSYHRDKCELCGTIQLTLYNFEDYIEYYAGVKADTLISSYKDGTERYVYAYVVYKFEAKGNTHYKYNDVSIVIEFKNYDSENAYRNLINSYLIGTGKDIETEAVPYDTSTKTVHLSLAGNGNITGSLQTPWLEKPAECVNEKILCNNTEFDIISISGTVQEY